MNEDSFLANLFKRLPAAAPSLIVGPGDDCAAIISDDQNLLLLAVDQIVGGKHYLDELHQPPATTPPELIGRKLLARNLSDIAAMGGTPTFCLLALAISPSHNQDEEWLNQVFNGLLKLAAATGVQLIGGDLATTTSENTGALTLLGTVPAKQICRRSGAARGDHLFATGCFGDSFNSGHHLLFNPRCQEGRWLAEHNFAKAMIDVSDGFLLDGLRLSKSSKVGLQLNPDHIPLRNPQRPWQKAMTDGEDYELLFAVAPEKSRQLIDTWPFPLTKLSKIGTFIETNQPDIVDQHGNTLCRESYLGYDHWQSP